MHHQSNISTLVWIGMIYVDWQHLVYPYRQCDTNRYRTFDDRIAICPNDGSIVAKSFMDQICKVNLSTKWLSARPDKYRRFANKVRISDFILNQPINVLCVCRLCHLTILCSCRLSRRCSAQHENWLPFDSFLVVQFLPWHSLRPSDTEIVEHGKLGRKSGRGVHDLRVFGHNSDCLLWGLWKTINDRGSKKRDQSDLIS